MAQEADPNSIKDNEQRETEDEEISLEAILADLRRREAAWAETRQPGDSARSEESSTKDAPAARGLNATIVKVGPKEREVLEVVKQIYADGEAMYGADSIGGIGWSIVRDWAAMRQVRSLTRKGLFEVCGAAGDVTLVLTEAGRHA